MKPTSLTEQLMFNTVRIEAHDGSSGTGFFFNFSDGEFTIPVLITNKHVVNYNRNETVKFLLHLNEGDGQLRKILQLHYKQNGFFILKKICVLYLLIQYLRK